MNNRINSTMDDQYSGVVDSVTVVGDADYEVTPAMADRYEAPM